MTAEADLIRDQRRAFATPGGDHDRLITFLSKSLPAAIGIVAAVLILSPLSQRGEIGFLLDRNEVAITKERIAIEKANYRGQDNIGRDFSVMAGKAVQATSANPVVVLSDLEAHIELSDGPAKIWAAEGLYNYDSENITVEGPVNFEVTDGFKMVTGNVAINLNTHEATGAGGVTGSVPTGSFEAESIIADLDARTLTLEGNAKLLMTPGKLRVPR